MEAQEKDIAITVTDENWQSVVIDSELPVLVDFGAEWNTEARQVSLYLEDIADEQWGELKVAHVDVDQSPRLAAEFGIKSLPTVLVLIDGYEEDRMVGVITKEELVERAMSFLAFA